MESSLGALWSPRRTVTAALAVAAAASAVVGFATGANTVPVGSISLTAAIAVGFTAMAALVLAGVPGHPVGRLMAAAGVASLVTVVAAGWSEWTPLAWLSQWLWLPPLGLIVLALLLFPDGRLPSRRWAPLAWFLAVTTALAALALAVAAVDHPHTLLSDLGVTRTGRAQALVAGAKAVTAAGALGALAVLGSLWTRWRSATGDVRAQLVCLLAAALVFVVALLLDARHVPGVVLLAAIAMPVAMMIAVLRYRLYRLDRIINRTVVWLIMTVLVIIGFVAIVTVLRDLVTGGNSTQSSLVATGLIVVGFEPAHRRVQRWVNQLLYGERDDPYKVIKRLSELLGYTLDPRDILPLLTETIARSLRVPYAAVELHERDGSTRLLAEHGELTTGTQGFDMVTHGERVGRLLVATRAVGDRFTVQECRLLEGAAVHAAVAAEAIRLIGDLEDSRNRLIVAQDKERARLWRDLHDGVAPALTGMAMQVRAARKCVENPERVRAILDGLATDLRDCTSELRQLVDHLQPHALERGLAAALRTECRRFTTADLSIDLDVPEDLEGLPIATQAAAYRIVTEALHNVARHANARTCRVSVDRDKTLTVKIIDDGVGFTAPRAAGVGLTSMRERAFELGGDCIVTAARPRGTAVRVRLPIAPMMRPSSEG